MHSIHILLFALLTAVATAGEWQVLFDSGTFALQAHDPESVVKIKSLKVKSLP